MAATTLIRSGNSPALPESRSNFENSGSRPPAFAFVFAAPIVKERQSALLLLLFNGPDQAALRAKQPKTSGSARGPFLTRRS